MAEAFGLAAGVLQVAGFGAEVGGALFKCAKKLHNASKELEAIAGQVEITSLSLRRVDELLRDPATEALHTPKLYEDTNTVSDGCHEVFCELDKSVKAYEAKSNSGKMKILTRTRWLFDSGRLMELGKVLRHYNDVLHLMVSVMTIVEGRRAATKDELQALEADLQLLAISNRDLSHSNKTLTETIAAISRAPKSPPPVKARELTPPAPLSTITTSVNTVKVNDAHNGLPFIAFTAMAPVNTIQPVNQDPAPSDPMTDHLKRCMDSVQELAKTIAGAMDAWHGKTDDSSDVHGSFSRLATQVSNLPKELQCVHCSRVVTWSGFKRPKLEPGAAGICICTRESSHKHWGPFGEVLQLPDDLQMDFGFDIEVPPLAAGGAVDPSLIKPFEPTSAFQYPDIPATTSPPNMAYPLMPSPAPWKTSVRSPRSSNGRVQDSAHLHAANTYYQYSAFPSSRRASNSSIQSRHAQGSDSEQSSNKGLCPFPTCGRHFKDLKQHMLTHQNERPEKCHIPACEYSVTGFARKYDKNRHVVTHYKGILVCGFCIGTTKEFTRADVFKRHLTSVHGVAQTPPNARRRTAHAKQPPPGNADAISAPCNICKLVFADAQEFYEHLDDCVLLEITSSSSQNHASPPSGIMYHTFGATRHKFEPSEPLDHESELAPDVSASQSPKLQVQRPVTDTFDSFEFGANGSKSMDFAVGSSDALENFDFDKFLKENEQTSRMTLGGHMSVFDHTDTRSHDDRVPLAGQFPRHGGRKPDSRLSSEARARSSNMRAVKDVDRSPSSGPTRTTFGETSSDQQPLSHSDLPTDDEWSQAQVQAWLVEHEFSAQWQAAFSHLEIYGMRFLELGVSGAKHDTSFMHRKLLPQVSREYEKAGLTADTARERETGRTLRRLVKTIVVEARSRLMHSEVDTVALKRARNTAAARQSRAREGERRHGEARAHERSSSPPSASIASSETQPKSVSDSGSDDGLFAIPVRPWNASSHTEFMRPTLNMSTIVWRNAPQMIKQNSDEDGESSDEDDESLNSQQDNIGGKPPGLPVAIPSSPDGQPVDREVRDHALPTTTNKPALPPLSISPRTQRPKLSLVTPMSNQGIAQESSSMAQRKLTLAMLDSSDGIAHSRSKGFTHRTEYSDTAGSVPSHTTATVGFGGVGKFLDRNTDEKSKRHLAEAVVGGVAANRLANGPRSKSRGRSVHGCASSPDSFSTDRSARPGARSRSRSVIDRFRGRSPLQDHVGSSGEKQGGGSALHSAGKRPPYVQRPPPLPPADISAPCSAPILRPSFPPTGMQRHGSGAPMAAATYIPGGNGFGPDVGIPPLPSSQLSQHTLAAYRSKGSNRRAPYVEDYESDVDDDGPNSPKGHDSQERSHACRKRQRTGSKESSDIEMDGVAENVADGIGDNLVQPGLEATPSCHGKVDDTVVFRDPGASSTDPADLSPGNPKKRKQPFCETHFLKRSQSDATASSVTSSGGAWVSSAQFCQQPMPSTSHDLSFNTFHWDTDQNPYLQYATYDDSSLLSHPRQAYSHPQDAYSFDSGQFSEYDKVLHDMSGRSGHTFVWQPPVLSSTSDSGASIQRASSSMLGSLIPSPPLLDPSKLPMWEIAASSQRHEIAAGTEDDMNAALDDAADDVKDRPALHNEKRLSPPNVVKSFEDLSSLKALLGRWLDSGATATLLKTDG